jgi:hypothetical protein
MKTRTLMLAAFFLTLGFSVSSCDSIEAAFDCNDVCNRYKDCYDSSYDVTTCRNNCRAGADSDANKKAKADACQSCIDGKSCAGATFSCATECAGIVP